MEEVAKQIKVKGKVQGVYFRASTQKVAIELGIKGRVWNEPDGSVAIEAEAGPEILEKFIQWCNVGPTAAKVDEVVVEEKGVSGYNSFEVLR